MRSPALSSVLASAVLFLSGYVQEEKNPDDLNPKEPPKKVGVVKPGEPTKQSRNRTKAERLSNVENSVPKLFENNGQFRFRLPRNPEFEFLFERDWTKRNQSWTLPPLRKKAAAVKLVGKPLKFTPDSPLSMEVLPGHAVIAKPTDELSALQTFSFDPYSVACALYDSDSKIGVLVNFDRASKVKDLEKILLGLQESGVDLEKLKAYIHGGNNAIKSELLFTDIQILLEGHNVPIVYASQGGEPFNAQINLNLENGDVNSYKETIPYRNNSSRRTILLEARRFARLSPCLLIQNCTDIPLPPDKSNNYDDFLEPLDPISLDDLDRFGK